MASQLRTLGDWQIFMQHHIFAVWDFMSLLKRLQHDLAPIRIPWRPSGHGAVVRLLHEIILAEESDADGQGGYCSHFELYRRAMADAGADERPIETLLAALETGNDACDVVQQARLPAAVRDFVAHTLGLALNGQIHEVAASFLYGREAMLPALFSQLAQQMSNQEPGLERLSYYLCRHIEVDGDEHAPAAHRMLMMLCAEDANKWAAARAAAEQSLKLRKTLWQFVRDEVARGRQARDVASSAAHSLLGGG